MSKKPVEGHKFSHVRYMAQTVCECGWESERWIGAGSRKQAYQEFRAHIDRCTKAPN